MASPLSAVGLSLAQLEIARALQGVDDLVARTNKKLADAGQDELPRAFYTAGEMNLVLARHAQELDALRPAPSTSAWEEWKSSGSTTKPGGLSFAGFAAALAKARGMAPNAEASAVAALDLIAAAMVDSRITTLEMFRETIRPAVMIVPRPQPDPRRLRHIRSWLDAVTQSWAAADGEPAIDGELEDDDELLLADAGQETPPKPAPKVVAAIEDGVVVPIGRKGRSDAH